MNKFDSLQTREKKPLQHKELTLKKELVPAKINETEETESIIEGG